MHSKVEDALEKFKNTSCEIEAIRLIEHYIAFLEESVNMASGGTYSELLDEAFEAQLDEMS